MAVVCNRECEDHLERMVPGIALAVPEFLTSCETKVISPCWQCPVFGCNRISWCVCVDDVMDWTREMRGVRLGGKPARVRVEVSE